MMNRMKEALPVMRKSLKLSQSDLARLSGVSRGGISNVECGKQNMTWNTFLAIISVFRANQNCEKLFEAFGIKAHSRKGLQFS